MTATQPPKPKLSAVVVTAQPQQAARRPRRPHRLPTTAAADLTGWQGYRDPCLDIPLEVLIATEHPLLDDLTELAPGTLVVCPGSVPTAPEVRYLTTTDTRARGAVWIWRAKYHRVDVSSPVCTQRYHDDTRWYPSRGGTDDRVCRWFRELPAPTFGSPVSVLTSPDIVVELPDQRTVVVLTRARQQWVWLRCGESTAIEYQYVFDYTSVTTPTLTVPDQNTGWNLLNAFWLAAVSTDTLNTPAVRRWYADLPAHQRALAQRLDQPERAR